MIISYPIIVADPDKTTGLMLSQLLKSCAGMTIICAHTIEDITALISHHATACLILSDRFGRLQLTQAHEEWQESGFKGHAIMIESKNAPHSPPIDTLHTDDICPPETTERLYEFTLKTPFRIEQLIAMLREIIANASNALNAPHDEIVMGAFILRTNTRMLLMPNTNTARLTEKECAIIQFLYHNSPNIVARHHLLSQVWGYNTNVTTHTLETHIYRLRQKLEADPTGAHLLVTDGGGYRLNIQS